MPRAAQDGQREEGERDEDERPAQAAIRPTFLRRATLVEPTLPVPHDQDDGQVQQSGDQDGPRERPPEAEIVLDRMRGGAGQEEPIQDGEAPPLVGRPDDRRHDPSREGGPTRPECGVEAR